MRLTFDATRCVVFTTCRGHLPELFVEDEDGQTVLVGDGQVPEGLEERGTRAVLECPSGAIAEAE